MKNSFQIDDATLTKLVQDASSASPQKTEPVACLGSTYIALSQKGVLLRDFWLNEGELWWFDNKQPHESFNASDQWRIHLIFDVLPAGIIPNYGRESHSLDETREKIAR